MIYIFNIITLELKYNLNEYTYLKTFCREGKIHEVILKNCIK